MHTKKKDGGENVFVSPKNHGIDRATYCFVSCTLLMLIDHKLKLSLGIEALSNKKKVLCNLFHFSCKMAIQVDIQSTRKCEKKFFLQPV